MADETIRDQWTTFINDPKYKEYFTKPTKKSTTIVPKEDKPKEDKPKEKKKRDLSEYQELTKKMSIQNSNTTNRMFDECPDLWHKYHDNRDFSFKGYDKQEEIPVNKIITYLEKKKTKRLKILDLGCGRNLIKQHFKSNKKFNIIGYDYVSHNGSIKCDISKLPEENESVDVCIFSQSLMGSNWKEYIDESLRVLRYNGEIIISESIERYDLIRSYIDKLGCHVKKSKNKETDRWFYLHIIND